MRQAVRRAQGRCTELPNLLQAAWRWVQRQPQHAPRTDAATPATPRDAPQAAGEKSA